MLRPLTLPLALAAVVTLTTVTSIGTTPAFADGHAAKGLTIMESPHDVATTVEKLTAAIEKSPATLFATIDHGAGAKKAGLELPPAVLVLFGNPKVGTPIMQADARAGLDLPVRVLVHEVDGKTMLVARNADGLKALHDIAAAEKPLNMLDGAIGKLMEAATK